MPGSLRDEGARVVHPRTENLPGIDRSTKSECRASHVTNSRKTIHQEAFHYDHTVDREIGQGSVPFDRTVVVVDHDVCVAIDQSRHQRATTAVDHLGQTIGLDPTPGDLLDQVPFDQNAHAHGELVALAIEDVDAGEQNLRQCFLFGGSRSGDNQHGASNAQHAAAQGSANHWFWKSHSDAPLM